MLIKEFNTDKLLVKVYDTRCEMGKSAAKEAGTYLINLLEKKKEIYAVFAAAPSQDEFLAGLAVMPGIDWKRIHALHMDEYVGLSADAPQGFGQYLKRSIFDKVPFASVNYIGADKDPEKACSDYDNLLNEHPIDVVFMGIGENGHIAFNDPHVADFNDTKRIKKVELDNVCRQQQVNDGCFSKLEDVPRYALTLTIPTLMSADRLFCIVPAQSKANAVRDTVYGGISHACPASILRNHDSATLYVDSASGKYLESA